MKSITNFETGNIIAKGLAALAVTFAMNAGALADETLQTSTDLADQFTVDMGIDYLEKSKFVVLNGGEGKEDVAGCKVDTETGKTFARTYDVEFGGIKTRAEVCYANGVMHLPGFSISR